MLNRRILYFIPIAILLFAGVVFLSQRMKKSYSWEENYLERNKGPYGLSVIRELAERYFEKEKVTIIRQGIRRELPINTEHKSSYILIGEKAAWDSLEINALLRFVRKGNSALIVSADIQDEFIQRLYRNSCQGYEWERFFAFNDTAANLNLLHHSLKLSTDFHLPFLYPHPPGQPRPGHLWSYFGDIYFCRAQTGFSPLGTLNRELINFARARYGEGWVYIHANPLAFTNIALLQPQGKQYAERVLSHLPPGPVYWDVISKNPDRQNALNPGATNKRQLSGKGPLDYILRQPALASAWYILLLTAFLFLLFRTKRRQRAIPVLPVNRNLSLEFVQAIGKMNFLQRYHKKIASQQMKFFLQYLRDRFFIDTREPGEEMAALLAKKIQIDEEKIRTLLHFYQNIERGSIVTDNTLMQFHQHLEEIYQHCKHYGSKSYGR